MNTLEMIKDWKESNYKKKYITNSSGSKLPYTAYNNGVGVLFRSYFVITLHNPIEESEAFIINKDNLDWEWEEIISEYNIEIAILKAKQNCVMISLASARVLDLENELTIAEVLGKWIERFKK